VGMIPTCHPDKPHLARGWCAACYSRWKRQQPQREPARHYNYLPDIPEADAYIPPPIANVTQHCFTSTDELNQCPHCGARNAIEIVGREAACRGMYGGCGYVAYLTLAVGPELVVTGGAP